MSNAVHHRGAENAEVTRDEILAELRRGIDMLTDSYKENVGGKKWEVRDPEVIGSIRCLEAAAACVIASRPLTGGQIGARVDAVLSSLGAQKHFLDEARSKKQGRWRIRQLKARMAVLTEMLNELVAMPGYVPGCSERAADAAKWTPRKAAA